MAALWQLCTRGENDRPSDISSPLDPLRFRELAPPHAGTTVADDGTRGAFSGARRIAMPSAKPKTRQTRTTSTIVELDHLSVPVRDLKRARKFYERALGAIGMKINMDVSSAFGMGSKKQKIFWLSRDASAAGDGHYALRVGRRADVNAFYDAALAAGGEDNGPPGPRPKYGRNYYAAFVKDQEGNNIEVVCYASASA